MDFEHSYLLNQAHLIAHLPFLYWLQQHEVSAASLVDGLVLELVAGFAKLALSSCGIVFRAQESALQVEIFGESVSAMVQVLLGC